MIPFSQEHCFIDAEERGRFGFLHRVDRWAHASGGLHRSTLGAFRPVHGHGGGGSFWIKDGWDGFRTVYRYFVDLSLFELVVAATFVSCPF